MNITVYFKDGNKQEFKHQGRAGGSWSVEAQYKEGWLIITDEYQHRYSYPADTIEKVLETPSRSW